MELRRPQLRRLILDEDDDGAALARRRAAVVESARLLAEAGIFRTACAGLGVPPDEATLEALPRLLGDR